VNSLDQKDPARVPTRRSPLIGGPRGPGGEEALRDHPRREIILGLSVGGLFLLVLVGGGMWAHLDAGVYAPGQIAVSGNRQSVQYRDEGIVSELDVHEGDSVKAGQVLL
jgi:multidrug efflux pump subunit AcrA (membrane-fusion protein)